MSETEAPTQPSGVPSPPPPLNPVEAPEQGGDDTGDGDEQG